MADVLDRKRVRLHRDGGSRKLTLSKAWLRRVGMESAEEAELLLTDTGITLQALKAIGSIEDDPAFPRFLEFLAAQAIAHPETLVDAADLHEQDLDLLPGSSGR